MREGEPMARGRNSQDLDTLQMALVGYQIERQKIEEKIQAIRAQLTGKSASTAAPTKNASGAKRVLSAAARRRIGAAQRKRWAEHRKRKAQAARKG